MKRAIKELSTKENQATFFSGQYSGIVIERSEKLFNWWYVNKEPKEKADTIYIARPDTWCTNDFKIETHVLTVIFEAFLKLKEEKRNLKEKLRKGAKKTNASYSRSKRQAAAKKAWKKRRQ